MVRRAITLLCLLMLTAISSTAQPYTEHHSESYAVNNDWTLALHNDAGSIRVVGWDQPRVQVDWDVISHAKRGLDVPWVEIGTDGQQVNIRTATPVSKTKAEKAQVATAGPWCVNYVVHVPRTLRSLALSTMDGDVTITGTSGDIRLSSLTGTVAIEDSSGSLDISTIHARQTIRLAAVSGNRSIHLRSVNGSIGVFISTKSDVTVVAASAIGGISNDFGWVPKVRSGQDGADLKGKLGDGSAALQIEDVNGGVKIAADRETR